MINVFILRSFSSRPRNYAYLVYMKRVIKRSRLTVRGFSCQRAYFCQLDKLHWIKYILIKNMWENHVEENICYKIWYSIVILAMVIKLQITLFFWHYVKKVMYDSAMLSDRTFLYLCQWLIIVSIMRECSIFQWILSCVFYIYWMYTNTNICIYRDI